MKLILSYQAGTYWRSEVIPFEYESEEALLVLFEEKLDAAIASFDYEFVILGERFFVRDFLYEKEKYLPQIMNLDQWFELNKRCEINNLTVKT